ncbi:MAG: glycosyltransferase [Nitrosopumilus sp.]|nr:glycosyltransferase [Nitrosopumilus sp.]
MDQNDLVSIVIPVYNSEKFLIECLESVLNQTYKQIEIITINDGSTDGSLKILQEYSDKITIISQKNQGLASALNVGIKNMNGGWFKWFSPDDIMHPKAIETLVNAAKNLQDNTIIYSNWDIVDINGKKLRSFEESNYNSLNSFEFNVRLCDGQQINVNTTLIPKLLCQNFIFDKNIDPILIDYYFFLNSGLLNKTKFHLIEKPLIKSRVHQNQLSHKNIVNSLNHLHFVRNIVFSKLDKIEKILYEDAIEKYTQNKPLSKKFMELGLKLLSTTLPNYITDKILIFYLNKIRSRR